MKGKKLTCCKCNHSWESRLPNGHQPQICPRCRNSFWQTPNKTGKKSKMWEEKKEVKNL